MTERFDILIIGGGINGCGIARDAAGRGYSVCLCEMNDLGSGTSSWSSKLVHGGLRYLEHYEFRLVREALIERERLWAMAPHLIGPLRFILPHHRGLRPAWFLRLGLLIYDHLGGRKKLPPTRTIDLRTDPAGEPLKHDYTRAFEYSDCRVDDVRLVVANARDAADRGASVLTRTRVVGAVRKGDIWQVTMADTVTGDERTVEAGLLVNAAGPWVDQVIGGALGHNRPSNVRLVQGSHIVVRKLYDHDRCYTFQEDDGRIIFAIPYEDDFTLIGTTDHEFSGDPADAAITEKETDYLLAAVRDYFSVDVTRDDIVWTYAGIRPLYDDGASAAQEATRDYVIAKEGGDGQAPLINLFGGKITTYRRLAEEVMQRIGGLLDGRGRDWTDGATLPGGDFATDGRGRLADGIMADRSFLARAHVERLVRQYGTHAADLLANVQAEADLGERFGADLYACEVRWLIDREWARTADDVVWRRTKLGLRLSDAEIAALDRWMSSQIGAEPAPAAL